MSSEQSVQKGNTKPVLIERKRVDKKKKGNNKKNFLYTEYNQQ